MADFRKNLEALKQANITCRQIPHLLKSGRVWWRVAGNLHEIEGSWISVLKTCLHLLKGDPGKNLRQTDRTTGRSRS